ncbi:MAG: hypothetical protein KF912_10005 [Phycisphaeraceae bacterium]|nr:hypothetical protein [Phycisphaeraceae bacterium]MBX3367629.1 hypothetical protein [Phycisphaeraceae bacterium]
MPAMLGPTSALHPGSQSSLALAGGTPNTVPKTRPSTQASTHANFDPRITTP